MCVRHSIGNNPTVCACVLCGPFRHSCPSVPVFFGCICGKDGLHLPSPTAWGSGNNLRRVSSVGTAIEFAKANNLLGIFVDADLLVHIIGVIYQSTVN